LQEQHYENKNARAEIAGTFYTGPVRPAAGSCDHCATYYTRNRAINSLNSAFIGGYTLLDAGASYTRLVGGHPMVFRVNGQNITRKRYWGSTGGLVLSEGAPGDVRFSISWTY